MNKSRTAKLQLASSVLLDAAFTSDDEACSKYGISIRTLRRYRRQLHEDPELAAIVHTKQSEINKVWAADFIRPLKKGAQFLLEAFESVRADKDSIKNPVVISSVAEAVRLCADVVLTSKVIDAQFSNPDQPPDQLSQEVSPSLAVEYTN